MDWLFLGKSIIAMLVITSPPDPVKILFFNTIIERDGTPRPKAAATVAISVGIVLGISVLIGADLLAILGINLDAFSVVGGVVIALMGFEMLYAGEPSKAQGRDVEEAGPEADSGLIMPLTIPLIAGPGAIVTSITIASSDPDGLVAGLIGAGVVAVVAYAGFQWLGGAISRLPAQATALLLRIGGLLLATIGAQLLLGGLKSFFEW